MAWALLDRGASCAVTSRDEEKISRMAGQWEAQHPEWKGRLFPLGLDAADEGQCRKAVERVKERWGRLDLLINNGAHGTYGPSDEVPIEEVRLLFDVHYLGAFRMVLAALPLLKKSGDAMIVMVTSIAGLMGPPWMSHYGAAKAAMNSLADVLRFELASFGIHVLTVMPGITKTKFGAQARYFGGAMWPRAGMGGHSARDVARMTLGAMETKKRKIIVGLGNALMVYGYKLFAPVIDRVYARLFAPWGWGAQDDVGQEAHQKIRSSRS